MFGHRNDIYIYMANLDQFRGNDINAVRSVAPALLFVYVTWCPHCRNAYPLMENVAKALGQTVPVYGVDGDKNTRLVKQLGVSSYPTILLVTKDGGIKKFDGERSLDAIIGHVCAHGLQGEYCGLPA